jgi:aminodeoxyfutalosine synthase
MEGLRTGIDWGERIARRDLRDIYGKVKSGERLSYDDGVRLFESDDLTAVGHMANIVRERKNGNNAYFIRNQHINHTNICRNRCGFCAFFRDKGTGGAYQMSLDEIFEAVKKEKNNPITEVHIVGGLNPDLPFSFYTDMLKGIKDIRPDIHIQAFTCVEVAFLSEISGMTIEETLLELKDAGLGSIPGGGAEVFSERLRKKYWPRKLSADEWLNVAGTAHKLGIRSNATMLYGHEETIEERIHHLIRLREQQDETRGFISFIPLAFHSENTKMDYLPRTSARDDLMTMAVSLAYGADDIDGTVTEEKITHMAGAETPTALSVNELLRLIHDAHRTPIERDTLYNIITSYNLKNYR